MGIEFWMMVDEGLASGANLDARPDIDAGLNLDAARNLMRTRT
jgi:hypothetical protein